MFSSQVNGCRCPSAQLCTKTMQPCPQVLHENRTLHRSIIKLQHVWGRVTILWWKRFQKCVSFVQTMIKGVYQRIPNLWRFICSVVFSFNFGAFWTKFESMCNRYKRPFFELLSWPPPFSQLFMMMDVVLCRKKNRRLGFFFSTGGIFGGCVLNWGSSSFSLWSYPV